MPLSIIGAGFGRTGTLSLKLALEKLGFDPCYHGFEVSNRPQAWRFWQQALEGGQVDWDEFFSEYQAAVDFPVCLFYRELAERYPSGKVILTLRNAFSWYSSVESTFRAPAYVAASEELFSSTQLSIRQNMLTRAFGERLDDRESVIAAYERHNSEVCSSIAPERLLIYEVSQGWEPLCKFLGTPVPEAPFPKVNSKAEWPRDPASVRSFVTDNLTGRIPTQIESSIKQPH